MAELKDFSPTQIEEAEKWFQGNNINLYKALDEPNKMILVDIYFKLKRIPIQLKPNEFIIGVDYKSEKDIISGKEQASLSFRNPHFQGNANKFAKDFLLAQLSKL